MTVIEHDHRDWTLGTLLVWNAVSNNLGGEGVTGNLSNTIGIGYLRKDDPNYKRIECYNCFPVDGLEECVSTGAGYFIKRNGVLTKQRYVSPGMRNLPDPIAKGKEIMEMLRAGRVDEERVGSSYSGLWRSHK